MKQRHEQEHGMMALALWKSNW